jgi:hypothetical protein
MMSNPEPSPVFADKLLKQGLLNRHRTVLLWVI